MKFLTLFTAMLLLPFLANSQSIAMEVIASSGNFYTASDGTNLHWTLGEVMTERFENDRVLTQGFHQNFVVVSNVFENSDQQIRVKAFPNPTANTLTIETESDMPLRATLFDLYGRKVLEKKLDITKDQLNLSQFSSGNYLLKVFNESGLIQIFKIQKINF